MLQPRQSEQEQQLNVARILWAALNFSMIIYGVMLYTTGKISRVEPPTGSLQPIEMIALLANGLAVLVFFFFIKSLKTKISNYF